MACKDNIDKKIWSPTCADCEGEALRGVCLDCGSIKMNNTLKSQSNNQDGKRFDVEHHKKNDKLKRKTHS